MPKKVYGVYSLGALTTTLVAGFYTRKKAEEYAKAHNKKRIKIGLYSVKETPASKFKIKKVS